MKIESTHDVEQREQDEHELSSLSRPAVFLALSNVLRDLNELPAWSFGSNRHDRLLRRKAAVQAECRKRVGLA